MARQQRPSAPPPRRQSGPQRQESDGPLFELKNVDFDPKRVSLPQIAVIGFLIGIAFHACVVFAVLDDGSGGSKSSNGGNVVTEHTAVPASTATPNPGADRTDCNAIRADPTYRSETERQWFLNNCIPR